MNSVDLFPCYSIPLVKFLSSNGIKYKLVGLNPNTMKKFWVYIKDGNLSGVLKKWEEAKII